jgi:hypothetical protein
MDSKVPYLTLLCLAAAVRPAVAQDAAGPTEPTKTLRAVRVESPPVIDGVLDDAVWQLAEPLTDFHQVRPGNGTPPSEPTTVYVLYDDDALYIGAHMGDNEPDQVAANTMRHGVGLGRADDRLVLILDPFDTGRGGYRFETNAHGVRHDMIYQNVTQININWDTIWEAAGSIVEDGWVSEIAIPFKSLAFDPASDTWGFNFARNIRRRGEDMVWVSRNRTYNPAISGELTGLTGMDQGLGLDIVPSLALTQQQLYAPSASESETNPSLDVYYRLTPSLNAALTINTDFSATEVDDRQVNLTRFGLFFPERRDFFLSDADLFEFGRIGSGGTFGGVFNQAQARPDRESARPFFSRRIGLSASGAPVDLNYGGKLSGRVGRFNIGTMAIRQDAFGGVDATDLFVGRLSANVLAESTVGLIVTDGDPRSNLDNSVVGFDFRYLNSRLPGGRELEADAWLQRSDTPGLDGDDSARGVQIRSPNNTGWRAGAGLKEVEANFNPALGFVNRRGVRDLTVDGGYTLYLDSDLFQRVYFGADAERVTELEGGALQSEILRLAVFEFDTNSSDTLEYHYLASKEVVTNPFTLYDDPSRSVGVGQGEYSFGQHLLTLQAGQHRVFYGGLDLTLGDFYDGTRDGVKASFGWRPSPRFKLDLSYDYNAIDLSEGRFISRLIGVTSEVIFSSTLYWVNLIQYDNISENLGINSRLQWIPRAGQEGFLVLNHNLQDFDKDNRFDSLSADLSLKFSYTFRF